MYAEVLVAGCGRMGRAIVARLAVAGAKVVATSRSPRSVDQACAESSGAVEGVYDPLEATRRRAVADVIVATTTADDADALLQSCDLDGRRVCLALYDTPEAVDRLAVKLNARGATVHSACFLATPVELRAGRAALLTDVRPGAPELAVVGLLGRPVFAKSRRSALRAALAFPVVYTSALTLVSFVLHAARLSGLDIDAGLDALEGDPWWRNPLATRRALTSGVELSTSVDIDDVKVLGGRVAQHAKRLGISSRLGDAIADMLALTSANATRPRLEDALRGRPADLPPDPSAPALGWSFSAGAWARPLGAATTLTGVVLQLVLASVAQALGGRDDIIELLCASAPLLVSPVELARVAARPRLVLGLFGEPDVDVTQVARELACARQTFAESATLAPWVGVLEDLARGAAERAAGEPTDLTAIHKELDETPSAKHAILETLRTHHSPGRVRFFERAGIPFVQGRRDGAYLADIDDSRVLLNLHTNGGVFNFGHRPPAAAAALVRGLAEVDIGNHHLPSARRARLAQRLARTMPLELSRIAFSPSATEATDFVVRLARAATGRRRIVSFEGSFHGTSGIGAHLGDARFVSWVEPRSPEVSVVPRGDLDAVGTALATGEIALVLAETVQASSGMELPQPDFYPKLEAICRSAGTVLALDEVQTGWGRTGRMWGFEHFGVRPDVVLLGKGMTGGLYPMAGCAYDPRLANRLEVDPFVQQSTSGGAELGCVVTESILDQIEQPGFFPRIDRLAQHLSSGLATLAARLPAIRRVNRLGLFCSVGFDSPALGPLVTRTCFERGLLVVFAGLAPQFVQFLPPLDLEPDELDRAIALFGDAVAEAAAIAKPTTRGGAPRTPRTTRATAQAIVPKAGTKPTSRGFTLRSPTLLDDLDWTPGSPHPVAQIVGHHNAMVGQVTVVELDLGGAVERIATKALPRFDSEERVRAYDELIERYVQGLRDVGVPCLDTWLWSRGCDAWVVQPAIANDKLIGARLGALSIGERRAVFRIILRHTLAAQEAGLGLDAHLANWSLPEPHVLRPVLLDVTQPLLRDDRGRLLLAYGGTGVPRALESALCTKMTEDLFSIDSTVLDIVANARLAPELARFERDLLDAVNDVLGRRPDPGALRRATWKVRALRATVAALRRVIRAS